MSKKTLILFIFVIFTLIEIMFYATYQVAASQEKDKEQIIELMVQEEVKLSDEEKKTLKLINEYRRKNNLKELKPMAKLQEVATLKGKDIVENEYFSHTSKTYGTPFEMLQANGVDYKFAGENLAGNTTPENAVNAWINSQAHKDNMLDEDFEYTGIAVVDSRIYGKVYVQIFMGM